MRRFESSRLLQIELMHMVVIISGAAAMILGVRYVKAMQNHLRDRLGHKHIGLAKRRHHHSI